MVSPPTPNPPTPPKPSICMLFAHIHTHIHIYTPLSTPPTSHLYVICSTWEPRPPPPPPQNLVFARYLHIYIHIYTYIYSPFHPSNLASLRYLQHLRATTSSTDLVYLYISIITFFSNRLKRASHMVCNIFATYGLRKAYLCKPRHMYSRKTINTYIYIYAHSRYYRLISWSCIYHIFRLHCTYCTRIYIYICIYICIYIYIYIYIHKL